MSLLSRLAVQAAKAWGFLSTSNQVSSDYIAVAGGGGGGSAAGGGGGAGGLSSGTISLSTLTTYTIVVGAGGSGGTTGTQTSGSAGVNSTISGTGLTTITSVSGGYGGTFNVAGGNGGSGGGGGGRTSAAGGTGTSGQGNNGGASLSGNTSTTGRGGGGGGASAAGATGDASGNGGNGTASSISGSSVTYSGGGGGGNYNQASAGSGGSGGGGAGGSGSTSGSATAGAGTAGTANLGGGGGGGGATANTNLSLAYGAGGNGGSGIVIISYTSAAPKFVGGTITTSGGKQIHTFTSTGSLTPITPVTANYLVVAGGGAGGQGGGGAGGLLANSTTLYTNATYIVTVGAGGASGTNTSAGSSGSNSSVSGTGLTTITSTGGGRGGIFSNSGAGNGVTGGSGGGGGASDAIYTPGTGAAGTSGQGYAGGNGTAVNTTGAGGGGGGAGAAGANAVTSTGGTGGIGAQSSISGTATYYGGGGSGGGSTSVAGGTGGGGAGGASSAAGSPGVQNTGGGGGGGGNTTAGLTSGAGGSGIVIISYAGTQKFNGGIITSSGGNTIHTFTATGALTPISATIGNSLRLRSSASAYLSRTFGTPSSSTTHTFSFWVKRGALGTSSYIYDGGVWTTGGEAPILFTSNDSFDVHSWNGSANTWALNTTQVFRDPSAWYHFVVAIDTTQATAANRVKIYVNGSQISAFATASYPTQNSASNLNVSGIVHAIGRWQGGAARYLDGYLADFYFIDGQALEPYYFGSNDSNGVWKPIAYYGMYGTNGFHLDFADVALTTSSNAGLGKDVSGNGNYWATNNISVTSGVTYDAMIDSPTNASASGTQPVGNYCTLNPLNKGAVTGSTWSNANLRYTPGSSNNWGTSTGTMSMTSGKWYWECIPNNNLEVMFGITAATYTPLLNTPPGWNTTSWAYYSSNGNKYTNSTATSYGSSFTTNDVIGVAFDADAGTLTFYKNNTSQGVAFSGIASGEYVPHVGATTLNGTNTVEVNFGQRPFAYTPPTGFQALCTTNLPTPTIMRGNQYMDATLYTGVGATQTITGYNFQPELVWVKARSAAYDHKLVDVVRGLSGSIYRDLESNTTDAEGTPSDGISSLNSNGFTITGGGNPGYNGNTTTFVAWAWDAGSSTVTNTSGTISSQVRANPTSGVSVVTYTGNGTGQGATIGHGLGVTPAMIICRSRSNTNNWSTWHKSLASSTQGYLNLNTTGAYSTDAYVWGNSAPTSSTFGVGWLSGGTYTNLNAATYVAYCFAEIAGFSKFGSYTGNGSTDGSFVYTGFRPKFVMVKRFDTTGEWLINDSSRDTYNPEILYLQPNLSSAEGTLNPSLDFLSNGFKFRTANANYNASGGTYIYMAFAENPFNISNAR